MSNRKHSDSMDPTEIPISPQAAPIFAFLDCARNALQTEYNRAGHLARYDTRLKQAHQEWEKLHEDAQQTENRLGVLGVAAIRAGQLAGLAVQTAEHVRRVKQIVGTALGWMSRWWQEQTSACSLWPIDCVPPERIKDDGAAYLRPYSAELGEITNRLHDIAIVIPATVATAGKTPPTGEEPVEQYVTLDRMAAMVSRSKRTLEKYLYRKKNPLPDPDVQGVGGKPNEWIWSMIRPWLESEFGRKLPDHFPTGRITDARADRS